MNKILKITVPVLFFVLSGLMVGLPALAQEKISAEEIIRKINDGQSVDISGAVVTGALDLTEIDTKTLVKNDNSNKAYKSKVNVPLEFHNCTFIEDVIAYKVLEKPQVLYTADFTSPVSFENCSFEGATQFKYSNFEAAAVFSGAEFSGEANFKYAGFQSEADFSGARFPDDANFKYAEFRKEADFATAKLLDEASFKYASFKSSVNFTDTSFEGFADFKYTNFKQPVDFHQTSFLEGNDFKYTSGDYRL